MGKLSTALRKTMQERQEQSEHTVRMSPSEKALQYREAIDTIAYLVSVNKRFDEYETQLHTIAQQLLEITEDSCQFVPERIYEEAYYG